MLEEGPYFMIKVPIVVKIWSLGFDFCSKVLKEYPIWVQFQSLPRASWGEDSPSRISIMVVVPCFADDCTSRQKRMQYARVLVKVDVTRPLIDQVDVDMGNGKVFLQKVKVEYKPKFCGKKNEVMRRVPKKVITTPMMEVVTPVVISNDPIEKLDSKSEQGWQPVAKVARHSSVKALKYSDPLKVLRY